MQMESILASVGVNKNDDVFLADELWKSRMSPVLKPVNWEHNSGTEIQDTKMVVKDNQTIGVTHSAYAIDENGKEITGSEAPNKFHVVTKDVIYQYLYPRAAAKIKEGFEKQDLFVSMEAWFKDYDYLVDDKIIARNEETAFLDRFLRSYGGCGKFQDKPVKRILRNFVFGGKGIVKKPANPPSVILSVGNIMEDSKMEELEAVKKEAAELKEKVTASEKVVEDILAKILASISVFSDEAQKKVKEAKAADFISVFTDVVRDTFNASKEALEHTQKELAMTKEENEKAKALLAKLEADKKTSDKLATIAKELGEVDEKIKSFALSLADEAFASFIEVSKLIKPKAAECADDMKDKEMEEEKAAEAATASLETVKQVDSVTTQVNKGGEVANPFNSMKSLAKQLLGQKEEGK